MTTRTQKGFTNRATSRPKARPKRGEAASRSSVTLQEFFDREGRGAQTAMATALDVAKGTLSGLAATGRAGAKSRHVHCSYALAEAIREYGEARGYQIDTAPLLRRHKRTSSRAPV